MSEVTINNGQSIITTEDAHAITRRQHQADAEEKLKDDKRKAARNIAVKNDSDNAINSQLRNYPQLIAVVSALKRVGMALAAGKDPGSSVTKEEECIYATLQLIRTARELQLPISKMENSGDSVYQYTGKYHKKLNREIVKVLVSLAAFKAGIKFAQANNPSFVDDLYNQLLHLAFSPQVIPDPNSVKINLENTTLKVTAGIVSTGKHNQGDNFKYCLPYNYDPSAECPLWFKFLNRIQPDLQIQMILQEFAGYCFIPNSVLNLEAMLILSGDGANGKSTFEKVLIALFGKENCSEKSLSDLSASTNSRAELIDKIANISSETKDKFDIDLFKKLASGEPIEGKILYQNTFTITNGPRHIVSMNKRPRDIENTHGFFRRWLEIPFGETITSEEKILNFENELVKELPGILNWSLEGLSRLMKERKFTTSKVVEKAIQEFREDSDSVLSFIRDGNYKPSSGNHIPFSTLYDKYVDFIGKGSYPVAQRNFTKRLEKMGFKRHTQMNVRGFLIEAEYAAAITEKTPF